MKKKSLYDIAMERKDKTSEVQEQMKKDNFISNSRYY